jgi:rhamnulokinase
MQERLFLAFDLGAESGRAILGSLNDGRLSLEEKTRFANGMFYLQGHWRWNVYRLFEEMVQALKVCAEDPRKRPESFGIDTWGVDFGLLGSEGNLLELPVSYRDSRTEGAMDEVFARLPREEVYRLTGIQFLPFNTLFQLHSLRRDRASVLDAAHDLLFMPDLFYFLLSGKKATEFTYATTSQLYNPLEAAWEKELFRLLDLPLSLMQPVVEPGTVIGSLDAGLARVTGLGEIPAVAPATHDTASAVAAVPAEGNGWAYISSGTWSLLGIETEHPIFDPRALKMNFTNEGGVGGTYRFLKNISGLWLLQACRQAWDREKVYSYDELIGLASEAPAFRSMIDPDDAGFLNPRDMPEAILEFCRLSGQAEPASVAAVVRCILESLAFKYRWALEQIQSLVSDPINRLHIIGGGSRNDLLCQFTADATGMPVTAGPAEATAVGNILMQALCLGAVENVKEIRSIVRGSFPLKTFTPRDGAAWTEAFQRFRRLVENP